ncbi:hypothetical protein FIBSPDRAFT_463766 [Athelia psychrophila]|uniref:Uncharacterized protein n=1 Tax=Athelia psychrophila TaxID=1759441 RepID=A0A166LPW9_9AGAM|nr:hypothetical protein FIBSPDRAFT_463766 [Fibularhizoctonia sp. CBS 109695]
MHAQLSACPTSRSSLRRYSQQPRLRPLSTSSSFTCTPPPQPPRVPPVGSDCRADILPWDQPTLHCSWMSLRLQSRRSTGSRHRTRSSVIYVSATQRPPDFFLELTLLVAVAQDIVSSPSWWLPHELYRAALVPWPP